MLLWGVILFILAIIIIVVDIFFEVFGILGVFGIGVMLLSMFLTYSYVPNGPSIVLIKFLMLIPTVIIVSYFFKKKQVLDKLFLSENLAEDVKEIPDLNYFLAKTGRAVTALRPYGHADFDGIIVEVRTEASYIMAGQLVQAIYIKDNTLFVKESV